MFTQTSYLMPHSLLSTQHPALSTLNWVVLAFWLLALGRTILNLLMVPRLGEAEPPRVPLVSIIVPARDEERSIEKTVRAFLAQTYPLTELIVVNDRSSDSTGAILDRIRADDPRLNVIHGEEPPEGWLGKPWALHQGSLLAHGEQLLFVDADVTYAPTAVTAAVDAIEESGVALVALLPHFEMVGFWENIAMPQLAIFAFSGMPLWLSNRSLMPKLAIGGGTGNLVKRTSYDAAGGHAALKDAVVDDVALARLIRSHGGRTIAVRASDLVTVRMYHGLREIVDGFTKNIFAVLGRSYVISLFLLAMGIAFHLLPYVLAIGGDPISLATVGVITLIRVLIFTSLRYRLDNALLGHPLMMVLWSYILVRSIWLTGVLRKLHWRGRTYDASRTRFGAGK